MKEIVRRATRLLSLALFSIGCFTVSAAIGQEQKTGDQDKSTRIYGVHRIVLRESVKPGDFEKFMTEQVFPGAKVTTRSGWVDSLILLRSEGDREYLWIIVWKAPYGGRDRVEDIYADVREKLEAFGIRTSFTRLLEAGVTTGKP